MSKKERPILPNLVNSKTTEIEKFQNEVIRPIIKMKHETVMLLLKNYIKKRKIDFSKMTELQIIEKLRNIMKTDSKFKTLILGCVVGQFTGKELEIFLLNTSEYSRRIHQIITKRYIDSIVEI